MPAKFTVLMDDQQVLNEYRKLQKENEKLREKMQQVTGAGEQGGKAFAQKKSALDQLKKSVVSVGAGYLGFQQILSQVQAALAFVRGETERAMQSNDGLLQSQKRLRQIATSTDDLAGMKFKADELAKAFGEDRGAVREALFSMRSTGTDSALASVVKHADIVDMQAQASVAGLAGPESLFAGQIDPEELITAGLVAAGSSVADFETLLSKALPRVAEGGAPAGFKPEEMLGIMGVMAGQFESPDVAGSRFRSLFAKMGQAGLQGMTGLDQLAGMSDEEVSATIGDSQEARAALGAYRRRQGDVRSRIEAVSGERSVFAARGETAMQRAHAQVFDPSRAQTAEGRRMVQLNLAAENAARARIAEEIANENQLAQRGYEQEAALSRGMARLKAGDISAIAQYGGASAGRAAQFAGLGGEDIETSTTVGAGAMSGVMEMLKSGGTFGASAIPALLSRIADNTDKTTPPVGSSAAAARDLANAPKQPR